MSRILVIGNEKGGCGKTTIAVNMAALYAAHGADVVLVDADPGQQSSAKWAARRDEQAALAHIPCVALTGARIGHTLEDLGRRYAQIVVDTGAEDSVELRACATYADAIIVPAHPAAVDLWALPTIERIYTRARAINPGLQCVIALNRVAHQAGGEDMTEAFRDWATANCPDLPLEAVAPIIGRSAYGRAMAEGRGVGELTARRDFKAEHEITNLWRMVHGSQELERASTPARRRRA